MSASQIHDCSVKYKFIYYIRKLGIRIGDLGSDDAL